MCLIKAHVWRALSKRLLQSPTVMYIHLQLLDNIRPLWSDSTVPYTRAPIPLTVNSLLKWRVQLGTHLARIKEAIREQGFWCGAASAVCITQAECERGSTPASSAAETGACSLLKVEGVTRGRGRGQRSAGTHLQEVILNVAVEGAAQAHCVILPQLVSLQVEPELGPAVLQTKAKRRLHLEEHGRQLLDVEHICKWQRWLGIQALVARFVYRQICWLHHLKTSLI